MNGLSLDNRLIFVLKDVGFHIKVETKLALVIDGNRTQRFRIEIHWIIVQILGLNALRIISIKIGFTVAESAGKTLIFHLFLLYLPRIYARHTRSLTSLRIFDFSLQDVH